MNVLVIGGGGREHALAWKAAQSPRADVIYVAPGNAGTAVEPKIENVALSVDDIDALLEFARSHHVDLTIVGPEAPLVAGICDRFIAEGLKIFGPRQGAAQLEGSKSFTKAFLQRHGIPTAAYASFTELDPALEYLKRVGVPVVIKADGLAAGKGVVIAQSEIEATDALRAMLVEESFGVAGKRVVIEEFLSVGSCCWRWMPRTCPRDCWSSAVDTSSRWRAPRITKRPKMATAAPIPAAWALTHRRRWSIRPCTSASCARSSNRPSKVFARKDTITPGFFTPA